MILDFGYWVKTEEALDRHAGYFYAEEFSHFILPLLLGLEQVEGLAERVIGEAVDAETQQRIQWAATILRNHAINKFKDQVPNSPNVPPPDKSELAQAQDIFSTDVLRLVQKWAGRRAGFDKRRQGASDDVVQNVYMNVLKQITRPAKSKKGGEPTWKDLPDNFVGNLYHATRNQFSNTMRQTTQGPPAFSVGTVQSIKDKIKQLSKKMKGQPAGVQEKIQDKINQLKAYMDELEGKASGEPVRRDLVSLGDPNAAAGWSGGKRRGGQDVGGDENDSAAQAIMAAVDGGEGAGIAGVEDRPGSQGSRSEIPGQLDTRDFNWHALHRALDDLAKIPASSRDANVQNYGMSRWQLAALAVRIRYGIGIDFDPDTKQLYSAPGQSMGNLTPLQDFARQRGTMKRQDLRRGTQYSSTDLAPHKRDGFESPDYAGIQISGKGTGRTMYDPSVGGKPVPVQEIGFVALQIAKIIRSLAMAGQIPEKFANAVPPGTEAVKGWIRDGEAYLYQWLTDAKDRTDTPIAAKYKQYGRSIDPETGKRPVGVVDYSKVGLDPEELDRTKGMRQQFKKGRFRTGGLLGAEAE